VYTGRRVFHDGQDGPTFVGEKGFPNIWHHFVDGGPSVLHRHALIKVHRIKSPSVNNLTSMGIYDTDSLASYHQLSAPLTGWNKD
jgi:hypothetical protein